MIAQICPKCGKPYIREQRTHLGERHATLFVHEYETHYFAGFGHLTLPKVACQMLEGARNPFEEAHNGD